MKNSATLYSVRSGSLKLPSDTMLFIKHIALLAVSIILGLVAAYWLTSIEFDFSSDIEEARSLGIVSITILDGYPKSRDVLYYLITLTMPILFAAGLWLPWALKERRALNALLVGTPHLHKGNPVAGRLGLAAVLLVAGYSAISVTRLHLTAYDPFIGAWTLLGEEGFNLAWMQSIFSGGVYGKDFFALFGPMLVYPLAWAMWIFGETVLVARVYSLALDLLAYVIIIAFLYRTVQSKVVFVLTGLLIPFLFPAQLAVHPHGSFLRVALAILPLVIAYGYLENHKRYLLLVCGVVVGQSLLFSQEAGFCSLLTLLVLLLVSYGVKGQWRDVGIAWLYVLVAVVASVTPMLSYLYLNDALGSYVRDAVSYPKLLMLGYANLPFPSFNWVVDNPASVKSYLPFGIIFIYIFCAIHLLSRLVVGDMSRRTMIRCALLLFGVLLFRSALGRSDDFHVLLAMSPAVMLLILYIDDGVHLFQSSSVVGHKLRGMISAMLVTGVAALWIASAPFLTTIVLAAKDDLLSMQTKLNIAPWGVQIQEVPRGGIYYPVQTAASILKIRAFLEKMTKPGDYVYFFPNEGIYYFLFNRNNPTRYASAYLAVTTAHREELIADLERNRPRYVIYSLKTWRIDDIKEAVQVPEVMDYFRQSYRPAVNLGDVVVLERIDGL